MCDLRQWHMLSLIFRLLLEQDKIAHLVFGSLVIGLFFSLQCIHDLCTFNIVCHAMTKYM